MKKGILIYGPTPILGGQLGANRQDLMSAFFGVGNNKQLVAKVSEEIKAQHLDWSFDFDPTESNAEEITQLAIDLVVVLPTMVKKFDSGAIPSDRIIQLSSLEYQQNDIAKILTYMKTHA